MAAHGIASQEWGDFAQQHIAVPFRLDVIRYCIVGLNRVQDKVYMLIARLRFSEDTSAA